MARTLAFVIEYDGTDFLGWQIQAEGRTVQGVFETALRTILQEETRSIAAGRTDTGVHALGQVVHCSTTSTIPVDRLQAGLNGLLPPDIVVHHIQEVRHDFHARYSATGRQYEYRILLRPSALRRRYAWYTRYSLDIDAMIQACKPLVGVHDFSSFCRMAARETGARCDIRHLRWYKVDDELRLDIEADRFLHNMVRVIVGTAVDIGRGRWAPDVMRRMLEAQNRCAAGTTAPPHGLCLMRVTYPETRWKPKRET